jgi:HK97 gp10 family phage protein
MAGVAFHIESTDKLAADLVKTVSARAFENAAIRGVVAAVRPIVIKAQALAPTYQGQRSSKKGTAKHGGGSLKTSIGFQVRRYRKSKTYYGVVGAVRGNGLAGAEPANYAHLVEFGGYNKKAKKRNAAKPFLRPAFDATKDKASRELSEAFGRAVQAEFYKKSRK